MEQSWEKVYSRVTTKSIPLLQPEHGFCQKNGSERGHTGFVSEWKNGSVTCLFEWHMLFFSVSGYCNVLTKIKTISLCLFWLFKEMLSMQFFWNMQRKVNYPRAIKKFEISHQTFVMITHDIIRCNLSVGVFRTSSSI